LKPPLKPPLKPEDARLHPRYAAEVEGKLRMGHLELDVRTRNVSRGGICFVLDQQLPRGSDIELDIALMFDEGTVSESLRLKARIVWCTAVAKGRWQVGASFFAVSGDSRRYLDLFVKYMHAAVDREREREQEPPEDT
jgi:hypothetical protein